MVAKAKHSDTEILKAIVEGVFEAMVQQAPPDSLPTPDAVMKEVDKILTNSAAETSPSAAYSRGNPIRAFREAYHYAVDLFFDALAPGKKGPPSYPAVFIKKLEELRSQGKSYGQIAHLIDLPTSPASEYTKSKDRVRKLIKRTTKTPASRNQKKNK
jgi:hypothetical protein